MKVKVTKKQWWLGAIILCLVALAGVGVWRYMNRPQDIGPKLEYIGEANFGCSWVAGILTLGLCGDREPNHAYIYATDMDEAEFKTYFTKATKLEAQPIHNYDPPYIQTGTELYLRKDNQAATINYYLDAQKYFSKAGRDTAHIKTSKPHIVEIYKVEYQLVKNSY
jgi:hypothetical protein